MHAAIRRYVDNTELADRLNEHAAEVRDLISGIEGFHAYYLVRGHDSTVSVSIFDDAAGAEESSRVAAAWMKENLPELAAEPPRASVGEIVIAVTR
jgi:hypothetical protein